MAATVQPNPRREVARKKAQFADAVTKAAKGVIEAGTLPTERHVMAAEATVGYAVHRSAQLRPEEGLRVLGPRIEKAFKAISGLTFDHADTDPDISEVVTRLAKHGRTRLSEVQGSLSAEELIAMAPNFQHHERVPGTQSFADLDLRKDARAVAHCLNELPSIGAPTKTHVQLELGQ